MSSNLTPEERAELDAFWNRPLSSLTDDEFRRFIELRRMERGGQGE